MIDLFDISTVALLRSVFLFFPYFIIAKMLSRDRKLRLKESIYMVFSTLLVTTAILVNRNLGYTSLLYVLSTLPAVILLFFYFWKIKGMPYPLSLFFMALSLSIGFFVENISSHLVLWSFGLAHRPFFDTLDLVPYLVLAFSLYFFSIVFTLLLKRIFQGLLANITKISHLQHTASFVSTLMLLFFLIIINLQHFLGLTVLLFSWSFAFVISFTATIFLCLLFYTKSFRAEQKTKQKELEHLALLHYLGESEQQQIAISRFKHDYQNILLSLQHFIKERDWDKLEQYFETQIQPSSKVITDNNFALEGLSKIKPLEIRSILTTKLTMAQNLGVDAVFESVEEIDDIPVDSIALVRMLGILLDNATEELVALGHGQLSVACFRAEDAINFVIQNTCHSDILPLHQLKQMGTSTKGSGRGLGLSNLSELVSVFPNVALQTVIEDNNFIQILMIGGVA